MFCIEFVYITDVFLPPRNTSDILLASFEDLDSLLALGRRGNCPILSFGDEITECLLLPDLLYVGGGTIKPALLDCPDLWAYGPDFGMVSGGLCIVSHCLKTLSPASSPLPKITLDIFLFAFSSVLSFLSTDDNCASVDPLIYYSRISAVSTN